VLYSFGQMIAVKTILTSLVSQLTVGLG